MRGRLDHREPGPDGTLGVVRMRLRIAEINQWPRVGISPQLGLCA
jgi:hypothetical protein